MSRKGEGSRTTRGVPKHNTGALDYRTLGRVVMRIGPAIRGARGPKRHSGSGQCREWISAAACRYDTTQSYIMKVHLDDTTLEEAGASPRRPLLTLQPTLQRSYPFDAYQPFPENWNGETILPNGDG